MFQPSGWNQTLDKIPTLSQFIYQIMILYPRPKTKNKKTYATGWYISVCRKYRRVPLRGSEPCKSWNLRENSIVIKNGTVIWVDTTFYINILPSPTLDQCCYSWERMTFREHNIWGGKGKQRKTVRAIKAMYWCNPSPLKNVRAWEES